MITDVGAAAEEIRMRAEDKYSAIRSDGSLTPDAIRERIAQAYVDAKEQIGRLLDTAGATAGDQQAQALRTAFGIDDLAGRDPANRAALALNARDAQERVSQIDDMDVAGALNLLRQADVIGDEILARAVAHRAWDVAQLGLWPGVLNAFVSRRPAAAKALADLDAYSPLIPTKPNIAGMWAGAIATPAELAGLDDWRISSLAAGTTQP